MLRIYKSIYIYSLKSILAIGHVENIESFFIWFVFIWFVFIYRELILTEAKMHLNNIFYQTNTQIFVQSLLGLQDSPLLRGKPFNLFTGVTEEDEPKVIWGNFIADMNAFKGSVEVSILHKKNKIFLMGF